MPQSERWQAVGQDILSAARTELYMNLPFLGEALGALTISAAADTPTLATDSRHLFYNGAWLAQMFERSRAAVCRAHLHSVLHCLLRHPAKARGRDRELWFLACDTAVESMIDALDYRCLAPERPSVRRQNFYRRLRDELPVLTAEAVYRTLRRDRLEALERGTLARAFLVDDHAYWPDEADDEQEQRWQQTAARAQTAMETVFSEQAAGGAAVREQLQVVSRGAADYRAFLRRFAVLREEVAVDPDAFDPGYYAYGLRHYGNMPLIEPLETRLSRKIEDFVIAIDTSMSTSGELVRSFLSYTYAMLKNEESFFRTINLRILQCDDQLRADTRITSARGLADYMADFELAGQSATDFRPVFRHVDRLLAEGAFHRLRGLIYFTDGLGIYPAKRPRYDAAFVMLEGAAYPDKVPPWGIRVILSETEITSQPAASAETGGDYEH